MVNNSTNMVLIRSKYKVVDSKKCCQTKDYNIGICSFSTKHTALRRKNKDWLPRNQDNVSEWSEMSIRGLLLQWARTKQINVTVTRISPQIVLPLKMVDHFCCFFILALFEWVIDCCLTPSQQYFSNIMARYTFIFNEMKMRSAFVLG
jgi:hypothetical protein